MNVIHVMPLIVPNVRQQIREEVTIHAGDKYPEVGSHLFRTREQYNPIFLNAGSQYHKIFIHFLYKLNISKSCQLKKGYLICIPRTV